jgi:regulator of sirC expression with transglutaminase-like and TPR domain
MLVDTKISALINLLDDPDEVVFHQVSRELLDLGEEIVPHLENMWEHSFNAIMQERIEQVLHQIQFQAVFNELREWNKKSQKTLLEGAIIVAKYQYADLNEKEIYAFIDKLRQDIWLELNDNLTAFEKVNVFNRIFFDLYGFRGNQKNFFSPNNSFINNVIESRKGNPLSLSILYTELAKQLKLPVYGVDLPQLFVLVYTRLPIDYLDDPIAKDDLLFYINPFNRGKLFSYGKIKEFLAELKIDEHPRCFLPCAKSTMIKRMINNLIFAYHKSGNAEKVEELKILLNTFKEES